MQLTMDNNYYNDLAIKAVDDIEAFNHTEQEVSYL